ncbi:MAG: hypothetical protein PF630_07360 [Gammaproteobacteria bacterium]|jgi:hypothetical protein|nr:hypothetical protein [Gammaproteobacteria bacterium]
MALTGVHGIAGFSGHNTLRRMILWMDGHASMAGGHPLQPGGIKMFEKICPCHWRWFAGRRR